MRYIPRVMAALRRTAAPRLTVVLALLLSAALALGQAPEGTEPTTAPARTPPPAAEALAQAGKTVDGVYGAEAGRASTPAARVALAHKMVDAAEESASDPAGQYVLYQRAADFAARGGDAMLAFDAIDGLAGAFDVDALKLKADALEAAVKATPGITGAKTASAGAAALIEPALAADRYDVAERVVAVNQAAAKASGNAPYNAEADRRAAEVRDAAALFAAFRKATETLAAKPDDPEANTVAGRYHCLIKGDFATGLPLLARGRDADLKTLAAKELAKPATPDAQLAVADGWAERSAKETGTAARRARLHAGSLYRAALPALTGLGRSRVEKRLLELFPDSVTSGAAVAWSRGEQPVKIMPAADGFCVLTKLGGAFKGGGESIRLTVNPATGWMLDGQSASGLQAKATPVTPGQRGAYQLPQQYEWKQPGKASAPPVRMINKNDGFCVLSAVGGGFHGAGSARVYVGDDNFWYLAGRAGKGITVRALAVRTVKATSFRGEPKEHKWYAGDKPVRMIHRDEGFCYLSGLGGDLTGGKAELYVYVGDDGYWYLGGKAGYKSVNARATSIRLGTEGK